MARLDPARRGKEQGKERQAMHNQQLKQLGLNAMQIRGARNRPPRQRKVCVQCGQPFKTRCNAERCTGCRQGTPTNEGSET